MNIAILLLTGGLVERGAENVMHLLCNHWTKLGNKVTVFQGGPPRKNALYQTVTISLPWRTTSHKPTTILGKITERLYINARALSSLIFSLKSRSLLKGYDIVIPTDGLWQVLVAKTLPVKVVCVGHAGMGWTDADTLRLNPHAFVATTPLMEKWAQSVNPQVPVRIIPYPLDPHFAHPVTPKAMNLPRPIFLTVAALTKYKRIDFVMKAVSKTSGSLVVLGNGEEALVLKNVAQKILPNRHVITSVPYTDLPAYYQAADVFTLASEPYEAYGQVLIEAMAMKLPIVTTDDPIRRWLVGTTGSFVKPENTSEYAHSLSTAVGKKPQIYSGMTRFEEEKVAETYLHLFEELVPKIL
jgi:glycosyltransferase involved in cell wall biosynthesis